MTVANMDWSIRTSLLLLGAMVSAPFLDSRHYPLFRHFYGEWLAAALGLAACIALVAGRAAHGFAVPRIVIVPVGLVAFAFLQLAVLQPVYPGQTIVFMLYLIWAGMLAVLGHALAGAIGLPRLMLVLAWGLLAGGLFSALAGIIQFADAGGIYGLVMPSQSVIGNVAQANHFADQLWLASAAALYLFADKRLNRGLFVLAATMLLSASILSASRSVFLYLIAIITLSLVWHRRAPEKGPRERLFSGALAMLGLFAALQIILANLGAPNSMVRLLGASGMSIRLQVWQAALEIFLSFPLLGVGIGRLSWHMFLTSGPLAFDSPVAEHAHNLLLQLMAELGLFAAILAVGGLLAWLVRVLRRDLTTELWLALALLAVIAIHSQLEYPLWYAFFLGPLALVLGAADNSGYSLQAPRIVRMALAGAVLLGAVFLAGALVDYAPLRHGALPSIHSISQEAPPAPPEVLEELRRNVLFTAHIDLRLAAAMPLEGEPLAEKLAVCNDALRFYPIWQVAYKCALLHALGGQAQQAAFLWDRAITVFPAALPRVMDGLRRMPEAQGGVFAGLRTEGEKRLDELRSKGLLAEEPDGTLKALPRSSRDSAQRVTAP